MEKHWHSSYVVQNIENKGISLFLKFDILDFYPSISKDLLINAINFVKSTAPIDKKIIKTILMPTNRYYSNMKSGLKKTILILM